MNLYNVIIGALVCIASCTALYFTMQSDEQKIRLMDRPEIKSEEIIRVAQAYDKMLHVDPTDIAPSSRLRRDTLTLHEEFPPKHGISDLTQTLQSMDVLFDLSKAYRGNLISTISAFAQEMKLEMVSSEEKLKDFESKLANANEAEAALENMIDDVKRINDRDTNLFEQIKIIAEKLKVEAGQLEKMRGLEEEYKTAFEAINAKITAQKERKSQYESGIGTAASNAGVTAPMLGGEETETAAALTKLIKDIQDKYSVISQKQGELDGLKSQIADLENTRTERDNSIASLEERKSGLIADVKNLRGKIWAPDEGEPIPYIIKYQDYKLKYELVRGKVIEVKPQWKMVQFDIGRALVVKQVIGTTGNSNKILCPVLPGYEIEIARSNANGELVPFAKAKINRVSEYSAIADILTASQPIKAGDTVFFSAPVIEKIHTDLGGGGENENASAEAADDTIDHGTETDPALSTTSEAEIFE